MRTVHRWFLWFGVVLFATPILSRFAGSGRHPLPGLRGLEENLTISVPVFLMSLAAALVFSTERWRTVRSCFMWSGALVTAGIALFSYVEGGGGGLTLVICGYVLSEEGRRLLGIARTPTTSPGTAVPAHDEKP